MRECDSFYVNIWIAGDYDVAVQACREFCMTTPLCVTVTKTEYVYVGGAESGVCVRIMNYPRFPSTMEEIALKADTLAEFLRNKLCQKSYSIEFSDRTFYYPTYLKESKDT